MTVKARRFGLFSLLCLLLATWGFLIEPGWLREHRLALVSPQWPRPPLTIAVASDFHVGAPHVSLEKLHDIVAAINAAQPDLILLPGDFMMQGVLGGQQVMPEVFAEELRALHAPLGVYATLGNHDWWFDGPRVQRALEKAGIVVLENRAVRLNAPGGPVWLASVGDDMTNHADPAKAFAGISGDGPLIVMMHDPAQARTVPNRTAVAFAGHMHGGQVRLPFYGALITPGRAPRQYAYGWLPDTAAPTWVNAGIGTSILPVRFNCRPEYVLLRLSGKESS